MINDTDEMENLKPIKCWDCAYLGKCMDYCEDGCDKFFKWRLTFKEVAKMCNVTERTMYRWFSKSIPKALRTIYRLSGYKFKIVYDDSRRFLVRVINQEKYE